MARSAPRYLVCNWNTARPEPCLARRGTLERPPPYCAGTWANEVNVYGIDSRLGCLDCRTGLVREAGTHAGAALRAVTSAVCSDSRISLLGRTKDALNDIVTVLPVHLVESLFRSASFDLVV